MKRERMPAPWRSVVDEVGSRCAAAGLDLVQPFQVAWYNRAVDDAFRLPDFGRSSALGVLVGNTRAIWPRFLDAVRANRPGLDERHPLDTYVRAAARVISLLPAATEIVASLGMLDSLVGVSHECDYPKEVNRKPRVTRCEIHGSDLPSAEIDRWVRDRLRASGTLYTMDEDLVRRLRPDAILTQRLCDVCAVAYGTVAGFAVTLPGPPRVVNLEPSRLADILHDIRAVGEVLGVPERAEVVVASLAARVEAVRQHAAGAPRLRCALLEWIDPPFCAGHWGPELVEIAGGTDPVDRRGEDSVVIPWDAVLEAAPEVLVVACCGYSVERALGDLPILRSRPGFATLPAAQRGEVYVVDGSAYFSRPGPRIVDSLEILAGILHPEIFRGRFPERSVLRVG